MPGKKLGIVAEVVINQAANGRHDAVSSSMDGVGERMNNNDVRNILFGPCFALKTKDGASLGTGTVLTNADLILIA